MVVLKKGDKFVHILEEEWLKGVNNVTSRACPTSHFFLKNE
jgi:hypothetical protein